MRKWALTAEKKPPNFIHYQKNIYTLFFHPSSLTIQKSFIMTAMSLKRDQLHAYSTAVRPHRRAMSKWRLLSNYSILSTTRAFWVWKFRYKYKKKKLSIELHIVVCDLFIQVFWFTLDKNVQSCLIMCTKRGFIVQFKSTNRSYEHYNANILILRRFMLSDDWRKQLCK